mgnify:CR=1 FL=1
MNERNKQNRAIVRHMTSSQTPAEVEAQGSLETANPDWITPNDKKSPRQQAHDSRRGVKKTREALSNAAIDKMKKGMSDNLNASLKDAKKHKATSGMKMGWATNQSNPKPNPKADFNNRSFKTLVKSQHASTELVRNARLALAEKVLEASPLQDLQTKRKRNLTGDYVPSHLRKKANANVASKHPRMSSVEAGAQAARTSDHKDRRGVKKPKASSGRTSRYQDGDLDIASTEIVKNGRTALAEACWKGYKAMGMKKKGKKTVPNCVKEGTVKNARIALGEEIASRAAYEKAGEGDAYKRLKNIQSEKAPASPKQTPRTRRDTLGRSDATPSPNHPDYVRRGHEAAIARKKTGNERKAMAQRISNKFRAKRGLVPLLPGEKHNPKSDNLGKTEN